MQSYLKLIRFPNLLMVAFTMYAIRWALIYPMLAVSELKLQFGEFDFFLLVVSTVFITAAGYGINDYFDVRTDSLNRPDRVVIGKTVKRRVALALHWFFNTAAVMMGFYISHKIGFWQFGFLFVITSGLLWYYSTTYKRQFLIGNLIVALLTALVPVLVLIYEIPSLNKAYADLLQENNTSFMYIVRWVLAFSIFAFITTLAREIIKDIEDFEGDAAFGRNTLPVVLGIKTTKAIAIGLEIITIGLLYFVHFWKLKDMLSLLYITFVLVIPLLYISWTILKANQKKHYTHASILAKLMMLGGILYLVVLNYNISQ